MGRGRWPLGPVGPPAALGLSQSAPIRSNRGTHPAHASENNDNVRLLIHQPEDRLRFVILFIFTRVMGSMTLIFTKNETPFFRFTNAMLSLI